MSLDAFSVVLGFFAVVEVALGIAALVLGVREARGAPSGERRALLALVAAALLGVAVLSFPLHYLLLESWVPRWPGIMCVEGVRRIGLGTVGPARWLPGIVTALDGSRILVVFAAGAWLLLRRGPRAGRGAWAAILLGLVAALDGGAAFAYVVLPKEEIPPVAGCCTVPSGVAETEAGSPGLSAAYVAATALLGAGAWALRGRKGGALLPIPAVASLPLGSLFLAHVAAPAVLGLPYHHCAWCAFAGAPETIVGTALHVGAVLCTGWAAFAGERSGTFVRAASFGFLASAAMALSLVLLA